MWKGMRHVIVKGMVEPAWQALSPELKTYQP